MASDGLLVCVDPFPAGRLGFSLQKLIAMKELSGISNGSVRWLRTIGADAGRQFAASGTPPIDFIFIDGDHSYDGLRQDWEVWSELVATGGVIALHDSCSSSVRKIDDAG